MVCLLGCGHGNPGLQPHPHTHTSTHSLQALAQEKPGGLFWASASSPSPICPCTPRPPGELAGQVEGRLDSVPLGWVRPGRLRLSVLLNGKDGARALGALSQP